MTKVTEVPGVVWDEDQLGDMPGLLYDIDKNLEKLGAEPNKEICEEIALNFRSAYVELFTMAQLNGGIDQGVAGQLKSRVKNALQLMPEDAIKENVRGRLQQIDALNSEPWLSSVKSGILSNTLDSRIAVNEPDDAEGRCIALSRRHIPTDPDVAAL